MQDTLLTQDSSELIDALEQGMWRHFGTQIACYTAQMGGGTTVAFIDISQDGRGIGAQLWLSREGDEWFLGFYNPALFPDDDEGVVVSLLGRRQDQNEPHWVASQVIRILERLGVTTLAG